MGFVVDYSYRTEIESILKLDAVDGSLATIWEARTESSAAESEEERSHGTEYEPVGISILSSASSRTVVSDSVTDDSPEGHVDDPDDEGDERRKGSAEGHEDCANSAESSAAETKDDCNEGKCSSNGMEDEHVRQVVQSLCTESIVRE